MNSTERFKNWIAIAQRRHGNAALATLSTMLLNTSDLSLDEIATLAGIKLFVHRKWIMAYPEGTSVIVDRYIQRKTMTKLIMSNGETIRHIFKEKKFLDECNHEVPDPRPIWETKSETQAFMLCFRRALQQELRRNDKSHKMPALREDTSTPLE